MDNIYYVYAYIRSTDNTPYYIGKGKGNRAWHKKHTVSVPNDKTKIVLLEEGLTDAEAKSTEVKLIAQYGRKDLGTGILYNRTNGGEGNSGRIATQEHKQKQSKAMTGKPSKLKNRSLSVEHKKKIAESAKGRISPNKGKASPMKGKKFAQVSCNYCNKSGSISIMGRWHFDKCKYKKENN